MPDRLAEVRELAGVVAAGAAVRAGLATAAAAAGVPQLDDDGVLDVFLCSNEVGASLDEADRLEDGVDIGGLDAGSGVALP